MKIISDPTEILSIFQEINRSIIPYYIKSNNGRELIISNVPTKYYEENQYKEYLPPLKLSGENLAMITDLKREVDKNNNTYFELFKEGECGNNSIKFWKLFGDSEDKNNFYSPEITIAFGFIAYALSKKPISDDLMINNENIILHDWHSWNYINDLLIDITLPNAGPLTRVKLDRYGTYWGNANDHIFVNPPVGLRYFGNKLGNPATFKTYTERMFGT